MSKSPITWLELIKMKLKEEKAKGNSPSIRDVVPEAKKEWVQIKEGKHPKYIQGKAKTYARKKNKGDKKSRKISTMKNTSTPTPTPASVSSMQPDMSSMEELINELKLCAKCKKNAMKLMKNKSKAGGCGGGICPP